MFRKLKQLQCLYTKTNTWQDENFQEHAARFGEGIQGITKESALPNVEWVEMFKRVEH